MPPRLSDGEFAVGTSVAAVIVPTLHQDVPAAASLCSLFSPPRSYRCIYILHIMCRLDRYGLEIGFAPGDAGYVDFEDCGVGAGAWVCDRTADPADLERGAAGAAGVAVSGAAPAGE